MSSNNNNEPLVSVIMPSYNSAPTIAESINSVVNQKYQNWELLITDDNSTDTTIDIIASYNDPRIKLFKSSTNQGAGAARNNSISQAQGDFIAFLDSDDLWRPEKLHVQIRFMQKHSFDLTYSKYQTFDKSGSKGVIHPPESTTYDELLFSNVIGCLTAIYNAKNLGKMKMPLIRKRQDMGLWLNILKKCEKAYCINEILADYRLDGGMTSNKLKVIYWQWKFYREEVNLSTMTTLKVFIKYAIKGIDKQLRART